MTKKYTLIKKSLYRGFFKLDRYSVTHDCFQGGCLNVEREHVERGDAAAIVLYDEKRDEVLLLEQFRIGPAVRKEPAWLIEIVAGIVDHGETAKQTVLRESIEEAGYQPKYIQYLGCYYATPGGSSEKLDLFLGFIDRDQSVQCGGGVGSEGEDIRVFWVKRKEAMQWVMRGEINSSGSMLALLLAFGSAGLYPQQLK